MVTNKTLDFYTLRFFLYKYTPNFVQTPVKAKTSETNKEDQKTKPVTNPNGVDAKDQPRLAKIDRYNFDLVDVVDTTIDTSQKTPTAIFSKYDLTQYVSNYTFNQSLAENTFNWSVSLQNTVIPFSRLNKTLRVEGPELNQDKLDLMAEYEAQARDITDSWPIHVSKVSRGLNESELETRDINNRPQLTTADKKQRRFKTKKRGLFKKRSPFGIMLSDLIQTYDMVSMFIYKNDVPIEEIKGTVTDGKFVINPSSRDSILNHITDEKVLRSPDNTVKDATKSIFANEFNGFVMEKSFNVSAGSVDTVTISGDGITRLFGSTRRVIKSGLFQRSVYDTLETGDQDVYTSYQNVYSDKTLKNIFIDLFSLVYRIKPKGIRNVLGKTSTDENVAWPSDSFYDISALEVANRFQTNPFTIPPYLLALVMKRHGFKVRHTLNKAQVDNLETQVARDAKTHKVKVQSKNTVKTNSGDQVVQGDDVSHVDQDLIDQAILTKTLDTQEPNTQKRTGTRSPLFYSEELNELRPYFKFFDSVLRDFSPEMKTPFEIIDEIKAKTFIEFFERPDGRIFIRPPAYNDIEFNIKSSTIEVINATYNETARGIISRQTVGYSVDALPNVAGIQFFGYTNGKLLAQYGLLESMADANPNMKDIKTDNEEQTQKIKDSAVRYAEYLLRIHNAALKTGTIVSGYDPRIIVGRTYYDERNNKFGYITGVSKAVATGGNATITFNLSYVRDAFFDKDKDLQFERLDRLVDLARSYTNQALNDLIFNAEPAPEGEGKTTTEVRKTTLETDPPPTAATA